jgi:predicted RNase H-like HicB family nuclease
MNLEFTAVFRKVSEGYIGFVEELAGANTQGATLEETRANLKEAVALVLETHRRLAQIAGNVQFSGTLTCHVRRARDAVSPSPATAC